MSDKPEKSSSAMQILQTILVAVLLGCTGWLASVAIQSHEEAVRLRTIMDERKVVIEDLQKTLTETVKNQQQVLRDLVALKDADAAVERRVSALERK